MWAHYAEKHSGVCLGFDIPDDLLVKVAYTNARIEVPFGPDLPSKGLSEELLVKLLSTKAMDWSYEREFRVLSQLTEKDPITGLFFVDFGAQLALREVILGHRCAWTAETASQFIDDVTTSVRICKARPGFGRFEMAEQLQFIPLVLEPKNSARA